MPHDKIKDAARRRMAETGEPYSVARRAVIREHEAGCCWNCGNPYDSTEDGCDACDA